MRRVRAPRQFQNITVSATQVRLVKVKDLIYIKHYSHVMHIVSALVGKLRPELDALDAFAACFPAGTLSGAPKVRAMQIIEELEPTRRGVWGTAVLYADFRWKPRS